jgi:hypothetical protein
LAQPQQTREWWDTQRDNFELLCSALVEQEASAGDTSAAADRLKIIRTLNLLTVSSASQSLA